MTRVANWLFDPLWERFGKADESPPSVELERFRQERERWMRNLETQRRWDERRNG